jgi:hypothetical protein
VRLQLRDVDRGWLFQATIGNGILTISRRARGIPFGRTYDLNQSKKVASGLVGAAVLQMRFVGVIGFLRRSPFGRTYDLNQSKEVAAGLVGAAVLQMRFVGVIGFEPTTSCSQSKRSSQAELHPEVYWCHGTFSIYERMGGKATAYGACVLDARIVFVPLGSMQVAMEKTQRRLCLRDAQPHRVLVVLGAQKK